MSKKLPHNSLYLPYIALILSTLLWGGATPVIKLTLDYIPPFAFLLYRFVIACIFVLPIMVFELKKNPIHLDDVKNLIWLGILGQTSIIFVFFSLKYTTAIDTVLIETAAPILVIAAGHYFFNEKLNKIAELGIITALIGTLIVAVVPVLSIENQVLAENRLFGNSMAILYSIAFTAYVVFSKVVMGKNTQTVSSFFKKLRIKPMKKSYSPILHTSFTFYVALVTIIPFAFLESTGFFGYSGFDPSNLTAVPIIGILYMSVFSSIIAYIAFGWGLKHADAVDTAIFGYLMPLFTLPFAYLLLGEVPTKTNIIGSAIIAFGVFIAEKYKLKSKSSHK